MSVFGDKMRALAERLLAKFGIAATLHHRIDGGHDTATATNAVSWTDDACTATPLLDADWRLVAAGVAGLSSGRAFVLPSSLASAPKQGDELTVHGDRLKVEGVVPHRADDGAVAVWELRVEGAR